VIDSSTSANRHPSRFTGTSPRLAIWTYSSSWVTGISPAKKMHSMVTFAIGVWGVLVGGTGAAVGVGWGEGVGVDVAVAVGSGLGAAVAFGSGVGVIVGSGVAVGWSTGRVAVGPGGGEDGMGNNGAVLSAGGFAVGSHSSSSGLPSNATISTRATMPATNQYRYLSMAAPFAFLGSTPRLI
jgi:hypothetical protein